jgi:hypothetical protein
MDCVNTRGEAVIGYWAELRWRGLTVHYASTMLYRGGNLLEHSSMRPGPSPKLTDGLLEWSSDTLNMRGTWHGGADPQPSRLLYGQGARRLEWQVIHPMAETNVHLDGRRISGRGYSERLILTVAPWELPIDELRWGRAHFPGRSFIWIDWTGPNPLRLVLADHEENGQAQVSDTLVSTARARILLSDRRVLRQGPVCGTSVGFIPGVRQALSKAGLLIDECKWLSAATLEEDGATLSGEAIHEVVKWR